MEHEIDNQKYIKNRKPLRTYFLLSGILSFIFIHIITIFNPMVIKPLFQYIIFVPFIWILYQGKWHHDRRTIRQKWKEDISSIPKIGIAILAIIIIYGSIVLFIFIGATNSEFQYSGMLLYEIFWIFIFTLGAFSSWYGIIGEKIVVNK